MPAMKPTMPGVNWDDLNASVKAKLRALVEAAGGTKTANAGPTIRPPTTYEKYVQPALKWTGLDLARKVAGGITGETQAEQAQNSALAVMTPMEVSGVGRIARNLQAPLGQLLKRSRGTGNYRMIDPVEERMSKALIEGRTRGSDWSLGDMLAAAYGKLEIPANSQHPSMTWAPEEAARRAGKVFGATSASTPWDRNTAEMLSTMSGFQQGEPLAYDYLRYRGMGNVNSKLGNAKRALIHDTPLLSGKYPEKTNALGGLMGGSDEVPIDIHTLDITGAKEASYPQARPGVREAISAMEGRKTRGKNALNNEELYQRASGAVRNSLQRIAGEGYESGGKTFGEMWDGVRGLKPYELVEGDPFSWLRSRGLLEEGALNDPAAVDAWLRKQRDFPGMRLDKAGQSWGAPAAKAGAWKRLGNQRQEQTFFDAKRFDPLGRIEQGLPWSPETFGIF